MDSNNIDEILKNFGYTRDEKCEKCQFDPSGGANDNWCKFFNLDMPFGFQDIDPMLLAIIGEIMSNLMSGSMPINVANSYGNWLQLIAQVISLYNAQQQYSQGGPGRSYSKENKNISNPFTNSNSKGDGFDTRINKKERKHISKFESTVQELKKEIEELKKEISELKNE